MRNRIVKAARVAAQEVTDRELELINRHALSPLAAEDVFTFKVTACDNRIDRDFEAFPIESLKKLAELYVGKTVIFDHNPSAASQCARIYDAEVEPDAKKSDTGEIYARLVLRCYTVKIESNKDLIAEIQAGIKKEVSVGCAVESCICSICGVDKRKKRCGHIPGERYEGKQCYVRLEHPTDAYEISFVAVPSQRGAGTIKNYGGIWDDSEAAGLRLRILDGFINTNKEDFEDE